MQCKPNVNGLLAKRTVDQEVEWIGHEKKNDYLKIVTKCLIDFF